MSDFDHRSIIKHCYEGCRVGEDNGGWIRRGVGEVDGGGGKV